MPHRIFGIVIENKIDIATLISLFVSLGTAIYVANNHLKGANVSLEKPEWVVIWFEENGSIGTVLSIGADITYSNTADPGYNAAIRAEVARLKILGVEYFFEGHASYTFDNPRDHPGCKGTRTVLGQFVELENGGRILGCNSVDPKLVMREPKQIERVVLGGSAVSHETSFVSMVNRCIFDQNNCAKDINFITFDEFMSQISEGDSLSIEFGLLMSNNELETEVCTFSVTKPDLVFIGERGWQSFLRCS